MTIRHYNEDPAQAAIREVAEETGIRVEIIGTFAFTHPAVQSHPAPWAVIKMDVNDSKVGPHRHVDLIFVCRAAGGDLTAQLEEVSGARWVPTGTWPRCPHRLNCRNSWPPPHGPPGSNKAARWFTSPAPTGPGNAELAAAAVPAPVRCIGQPARR